MRPNRIRFIVCLTCVSPFLSFAETALADSEIDEKCHAIERYFATNEVAKLAELDVQTPRWAALKQFRLAAAYIPQGERAAAIKAIREGLSIVANALKEDKDDVEMLIMGSMLDGQYLLLQPWRYFWNGQRGLRRIARAEKLDSHNPRIALVHGTAKFILPRFLGGSPQEAQHLFEVSLARDDPATGSAFAETNLCQNGAWGQVDVMNWLARAHAKQGEDEAAERLFTQALYYSPGNYWVNLAIQGEGYEWTQTE